MAGADTIPSRKKEVDEKLMKPFSLGWKREVVKRVVTRSPACDIYYFNPSGKKIRSLNEIKSQLSDGLTLDCFSFKREILGVDSKFETVRDAKHKGGDKKSQKRENTKRNIQVEEPQPGPSGVQAKKRKVDMEKPDLNVEKEEEEEASEDATNSVKEEVEVKSENQMEVTEEVPSESLTTEKRLTRNKVSKISGLKVEKKSSKRVMCKQRRRSIVLGRQKCLRKAVTKASSRNSKVTENHKEQTDLKKETSVRKKRLRTPVKGELGNNVSVSRRREKSVQNASGEAETKNKKEGDSKQNESQSKGKVEDENAVKAETNEDAEDPGSADLKTIVQKNIGKYRELREKQKLNSVRGQKKNICLRVVNNSRAESFLKNKHNYLKPLQKGWRRELVFRSTCSKAGLQADVYYFHPSGKKFRSSREIMDHPGLTGGLSIEFFTFRKEAVGCGEPLEIIRNARRPQKN